MVIFSKDEIAPILISTLVIAFSANFLMTGINAFFWTLLSVFLIIIINIIAKKMAGFYFETDVETKFWEVYWFGFKEHQHLKRPFPLGAFLPLLSKLILLPLNSFVWMASLIFDVKPKIYRAARRHERYSFSGMAESQIGYIAAIGISANLLFALVGYLIGSPEFARLNIYYALFNMLPISNLDGNKILFGNMILWGIMAVLVLVGLFFAIVTI